MALLKRCSLCRKPAQGPIATAYWRWFPNGTFSVGYRVYYCQDHWRRMATNIRLLQPLDQDDELGNECVVCGTNASDNRQFAYLYLYPPKAERADYVVATCDACLDHVIKDVREFGSKLDERSESARVASVGEWSVIRPAS